MIRRKVLFRLLAALTSLLCFLPGAILAQDEAPPLSAEPMAIPAANVSPTAFAFSGGPDYDSGWVPLAQDETKTLTHNLGGSDTDDYVVSFVYRTSDSNGVNQRYYGGADFGSHPPGGHSADDRVGAYWRSLTTSSITVYRRAEDTYAEEVRVRIWTDSIAPDYDSGWVSLTAGAAATPLTHSLGGNPDDYVVDMQYKTTGSGVNQRYYGGTDFGSKSFNGTKEDERMGAYWRSLSSTSITVYRRPDDTYASQVRVRIWVRPNPTYDSGWVSLTAGAAATTLTHGIGGNPDDYIVDMQYKSPGSGVNQRYYGGNDFGASPPTGMNANDRVGAYWRSLTASSITVYRRPEDIYAPQVRIRIWNFWTPPRPDYDSGWVTVAQNGAKTLNHNLGGSVDDYLVDMQYKSSGSGINLRYYGGTDFGATSFGGTREDDRVGAYWRTLTSSSITVYRRPEDVYAPQVRVRIWRMPKPDYDSGWISLTAGAAATTLSHNLGGNANNYLVDMQYKNTGNGINQRYYGGADFGSYPPGGHSANDRVGAYWRTLTSSSITVYRRPEDTYAPQVRVRIWRMAKADYESGWQLVTQDQSKTLNHNLGGLSENYLVNMEQYDLSSNGINQRHLGGADFGSNPPAGYSADDRVGAYWRSLSTSSIRIYRRPEDGYADYVRIRIWVTPYESYLPLVTRNY
ncbi:MAG: hypothetical protein J7M16_14135 [Anaerolineae bacterium]|nr:hypothetical protein [Anaerolineae bacterium]